MPFFVRALAQAVPLNVVLLWESRVLRDAWSLLSGPALRFGCSVSVHRRTRETGRNEVWAFSDRYGISPPSTRSSSTIPKGN